MLPAVAKEPPLRLYVPLPPTPSPMYVPYALFVTELTPPVCRNVPLLFMFTPKYS
jgi:hypothetical protein